MTLGVLIVDDHASFRRMARLLLSAAGFEVVGEAADGDSAITAVARLRPDAVLLDVMLPDRCGIDVARELAAQNDPPRVVLTSSRSQSDFTQSYGWPGGCSYIAKHELSGAALTALLRGA
jgi:DNA-binding NarL/FixJ family response regulator